MTTCTEDEAILRWCPFARSRYSTNDDGTTANRCIASSCMAWRWAQKRNPNWKPAHVVGQSWPQPHPADTEPAYVEDKGRGYCGLAGRP